MFQLSSGNKKKELLSKVAGGDEQAFSVLIKTYSGLIHSFIYKHVQRTDWVEEIVGDIFLQIWLSRKSIEKIDNFEKYLFVLCRNRSVNVLRTELREVKRNLAWYENYQSEQFSPAKDEKEEKLQLIETAIVELPARQKQIWTLSRKKGFTYDQISKELSIGKETVKTHLRLATDSIKKYVIRRADAVTLLFPFLFF